MNREETWLKIWTYYQNIKEKYQLYTCNIIRQLGYQHRSVYSQYLSSKGKDRCPSFKQGTIGRGVVDILIEGMNKNKTDWLPSTASYEDKYYELHAEGYYHDYTMHVLGYENDDKNKPIIEVTHNNEKYYSDRRETMTLEYCENKIEKLLTIDGIVPIIKYPVLESYWLLK